MEKHGMEMVEMFRKRSAQNAELLANVKLRTPDILFDQRIAHRSRRRHRAIDVARGAGTPEAMSLFSSSPTVR